MFYIASFWHILENTNDLLIKVCAPVINKTKLILNAGSVGIPTIVECTNNIINKGKGLLSIQQAELVNRFCLKCALLLQFGLSKRVPSARLLAR